MSERITRRDALGMLGLASGVGLVSTLRGAGLMQSAAPQRGPAFEPGAVIRTLRADVPPGQIDGPVLFHEHLSIRYPLTRALAEQQGRPVPASFTDDVDLMIEETKAAAADGVRCIVDGGHPDMDRDLGALKRIAAESGVHIVGSGGYYMQRTYPADIAKESADQIADELVAEAKAQRLGALGEIGQEGGVLTVDERKVFTAMAKAQARSGLPIFTHNAYTGMRAVETPVPMDAALRQLDVLEAGGTNPRHVAIGHMCCLNDVKGEIAIQLAKRGVYVGFDRVTIPLIPDAQKVTTILALLEAGHADQLLLSSDFYAARSLKKNGGPGLAQTLTVFGPMLLKAGVSEATLRHILVDNSRRFLAFVPKN